MMSATNPVGSRFASLPLALVHPRKLTPRGLRRRVTSHSSLITSHCLSNRNKVRIEFAVTHSKQKTAIISNRNSFRGRPNSTERIFGTTVGAKKRLIATVAHSEIHVSLSRQKTSHFSNRNKNTLFRFQVVSVSQCLRGNPHARIELFNE
jgi:hypothetical protein